MNREKSIRDLAKERLDRFGPVVDNLAARPAWSISTGIFARRSPNRNRDQFFDHRRVLKYAQAFGLKGAKVTLLTEGAVPTPDLQVETDPGTFYLEVKKFRMAGSNALASPGTKIVSAIRDKVRQLPTDEIGLVALDNFDLRLESAEPAGLTHAVIEEALAQIDNEAPDDPRLVSLRGIIVAAHTSGGVLTGPVSSDMFLSHFVWTNRHAQPVVPDSLRDWITDALPGGTPFPWRRRDDR